MNRSTPIVWSALARSWPRRSSARCMLTFAALVFTACDGGSGPERDGSAPAQDAARADGAQPDAGATNCIRDSECDDGDRCTRDTCVVDPDDPAPAPMATCQHERFEGACTEFVDVEAGLAWGCALDAAGRTFCWGLFNPFDGSPYPVLVSADLPPARRVIIESIPAVINTYDAGASNYVVGSVSVVPGGSLACIITTDGEVWCWPEGFERPAPLRIEGVSDAVDVDIASPHVAITQMDGTVQAVTFAADGTYSMAPVAGTGPGAVLVVEAEATHADGGSFVVAGLFVRSASGEVYWVQGWNHVPAPGSMSPPLPGTFDTFSAGTFGSARPMEGGGRSEEYMLCGASATGTECTGTIDSPGPVIGLPQVDRIEQSSFVACARAVEDRAIWCWGVVAVRDEPRRTLPPTLIPGTSGASDFSVSDMALCYLVSGRVRCIDVGRGGTPYLLPWMWEWENCEGASCTPCGGPPVWDGEWHEEACCTLDGRGFCRHDEYEHDCDNSSMTCR